MMTIIEPQNLKKVGRKLVYLPGGRERALKAKYGITVADYDAMLAKQNGVCAICKFPPKRRRLAVDHNHKTGKVRGLLCWRCNYALGVLERSMPKLPIMLAYLKA